MDNNKEPTSLFLHNVVNRNTADRISIGDLKLALHERGFAILLVIFALPIAVPFPYIQGFTTILALPLIFFASQMFLGFDSPWLPQWLANKTLSRQLIALIVTRAAPYLKRVEKLLKPRLIWLASGLGPRLIGFFSLLFSIAILIPLPFTNLLPAIGILIMSLGLLSRDGVTVLLGLLIGLVGFIISLAVLVFGAI